MRKGAFPGDLLKGTYKKEKDRYIHLLDRPKGRGIQMKIKGPQSPLKKKARRGFRGYPVATVAFYGPDNTRATKVAVGIVLGEGAEPEEMERWFAREGDVRTDSEIGREILQFIERHSVKSVVMTDRVIGCPHEEGVDYPTGQACPQCPFWSYRDRWTGEVLH